ncbi:MAG: hypothetical protein IJ003_02145 [Candidatus Gastranaerophilales bacterium]|nr:hypothetical protein [Candidatus Gastranaerophilales bacterium]
MKIIVKLFLVFFLFLACINQGFCFDIKKLNPFKKKPPQEKPKMVETKQEWEQEAQNIPLNQRIIEDKKPEIDEKKYYVPEQKYVFEKYNYPQGKRELNIEDIKKKTYSYPYLICDLKCHYVAYPRYYFSYESNQISSNFYVEKLDVAKNKTRRILDYKHIQEERIPIIEAGVKEVYPNLFRGLSLVDWSHDSKKLLIKEKVGSLNNGIYKTYLYVHFMGENGNDGYTIKLLDFDEIIKKYFLDYQNIQIIKYKYDIEPLGFSEGNDDVIIVLCYAYDKENNKIFLGTWGYDVVKERAYLFSKTSPVADVSVNGLILKEVIE